MTDTGAEMKKRLVEILYGYTRRPDASLSDRDFVQAVFDRWKIEQAAPIIDVGE